MRYRPMKGVSNGGRLGSVISGGRGTWTWAGWLVGIVAGFACGVGGVAAGAAESGAGVRITRLSPGDAPRTGLALLPPAATGITFTNRLSPETYLVNQIYLNGSGVALGDVDGDGRTDVYLCNLEGNNALFRNLGGWQFEDVSERAGVAGPEWWCSGAVLADLNGDGDLDLVQNTVGQGTHVFLNDGRGRFVEAPGSPINPDRAGMSAALADLDGDGDLDLYVTNYRTETIRDRPETRFQGDRINGRLVVLKVDGRSTTEPDLVGRFELTEEGRIVEHGEPDALFLNDGKGQFTAVPFTGGAFLDSAGVPLTQPPFDWGLSVAFRDLNRDGLPDLYVCNDFESPDRLWWNVGQGRFQESPRHALRHTSIFSMGIDVGDLDRDGHDDLMVSDMLMQRHASRQLRIGEVPPVQHPVGSTADRPQYSFNTLQVGRGDGTFAEVAWVAGAEASGWTWCPVLLDVDLDGFEDVLFPTGHELDMMNVDVIDQAERLKAQRRLSRTEQQQLRTMFDRFNTPNVALRNRGDLTFEDRSAAWGFTDAAVSQGIAMGDLDNDGDLDVVVNNLNGPAAVYRNESTAPRVAVRLRGRPPNTRGIGARIRLFGGAVPEQHQEMVSGAHFLSSDDFERVFAAGQVTNRMRLEIQWRHGRRTELESVEANHRYEIEEPDRAPGAPDLRSSSSEPRAPSSDLSAVAPGAKVETSAKSELRPPPWFEEVAGFGPVHLEPHFDDAARQPLLPFRLSQFGPGVGWLDADGDGWEDLLLGSGAGGVPAVFRNSGRGTLERSEDAVRTRPLTRDLAGVVGSDSMFLVGSAQYEDGTTNGGWIRLYDLRRKVAGEGLLGPTSSTGPLAMADVDGDGDLDLFVGGRLRAGRYPEPADSLLVRNDEGRLTVARTWSRFGLVSGAVFTDLDADGRPDLVLACDWGPIRVFRNRGGFEFEQITKPLGLDRWTGWWRGVASGDLNGDGRLDLVASNWGLNSRYQASPERPLRVYYGDLDGDLIVDLIEARVDADTGREVPLRGFRAVGSVLPWLRDEVGSFDAYAKASLGQLYGDRLKACQVVEVESLQSMAFLNRGDRFEPRALPAEAQWTPAFGVNIADFDGDAREDVFLSQNFFAVPPDGVRQDAGRGLWLRGDGQGGFQAVPGQESGVRLYGEQRGSAVADYDGDGRVDLVVTQNGEAAKLFHNRRGRPGLRVRLQGPPTNRDAFGAVLRLVSDAGPGPVREVHGGSGYWSQDGPTQVLYAPGGPTALEIRWPGGARTTNAVPAGAREITVSPTGAVKVNR